MADAIARRWKLSTEDRERVVAVVAHHMFFYTPAWTDGTVRRFVNRVGKDRVGDLFDLREGDVRGRGFGEDPEQEIGELRARIAAVAAEDAALSLRDLALDGKGVMESLGLPPGRHVGVILARLLERVLDDPSLNEPERLKALLPEVAAEVPVQAKPLRAPR
jgi:tRNA nucleotidyltransferase (CCA-adding enzyme)